MHRPDTTGRGEEVAWLELILSDWSNLQGHCKESNGWMSAGGLFFGGTLSLVSSYWGDAYDNFINQLLEDDFFFFSDCTFLMERGCENELRYVNVCIEFESKTLSKQKSLHGQQLIEQIYCCEVIHTNKCKKMGLLLLPYLSCSVVKTLSGVCSILLQWRRPDSRQQLDTQHPNMDFTLTFLSAIVVSARTTIHWHINTPTIFPQSKHSGKQTTPTLFYSTFSPFNCLRIEITLVYLVQFQGLNKAVLRLCLVYGAGVLIWPCTP